MHAPIDLYVVESTFLLNMFFYVEISVCTTMFMLYNIIQ